MNVRKLAERAEEAKHIQDSFNYMMRMIKDINIILQDYGEQLSLEEIQELEDAKAKIQATLDKYDSNAYELGKKIRNELLTPEMVEYALRNRKYPENASETYQIFKADMQRCFELEDKLAERIVVKIWREATEKEASLKKGDDFCSVVHSGYGNINLPGSKGYNDSEYANTSYISCSLLTDKQMDMFNSNIGIEFIIDANSFVAASSIDCVTRYSSRASLYSLKKVGKDYIEAGYTIDSEPITRLQTPKAIERECCQKAEKINGGLLKTPSVSNQGKAVGIINEVILDKSMARPKNIILQTNGANFDFEGYEVAKKMENMYGVPIKVMNRSLYRERLGLEPFEQEEKELFYEQVKYYSEPEELFSHIGQKSNIFASKTPAEIIGFLNGYYREIVEAGGFDDNMKKYIKETLDKMIAYAREKQRKENARNSDEINH